MRTWPLVLLVGILLVQVVMAETATINFQPAIIMDDIGAGGGAVNNYTIKTNAAITSEATWNLFAANSQLGPYTMLDARKNQSFAAGTQREFHIGNAANFRYYYIHLAGGFPSGSTLEWHLNNTPGGPSVPWYELTPYLNWTTRKSPVVTVYNMTGSSVGNYSITTNSNEIGVSWYLFGGNDPALLGSPDAGLVTQIDSRLRVDFTAGVTKAYEFPTSYTYNYYVLYVSEGLTDIGTTVDVRFQEGITAPTPTPTTVPVPSGNVTTVAPLQFADRSYLYFFGTGAFVMLIGAMVLRRNQEIFAGLATVFALIAAVISNTVNFSKHMVLYDPSTVLSNGTVITNSSMVISHTYIVMPTPEITVVFAVVLTISLITTIRFYLDKVRGEEE